MTTTPLIIALAGPARSGKDTVAQYLIERHGFEAVAFADPLRAMLAEGFDLDDSHFHAHKEDPLPWLGLSPRRLLQTLGTEWGRSLHPDIWVLLMQRRLDDYAGPEDRIVITDVRFDNEADWVRQRGHLWHIQRPDPLRVGFSDTARAHASEAGVHKLPGDRLIYNDSTLEHLYAQIDTQVRLLLTPHEC